MVVSIWYLLVAWTVSNCGLRTISPLRLIRPHKTLLAASLAQRGSIPSFASKQGGGPDSSPSYGGCALAMLASAKVATSAKVPYKVPHMVLLKIPPGLRVMVRHMVRRGRVNLIWDLPFGLKEQYLY